LDHFCVQVVSKRTLERSERVPSEPALTCENTLWAKEDLNLRPHPYQGCALTKLSYWPENVAVRVTANSGEG
jgi:hypothetical protein